MDLQARRPQTAPPPQRVRITDVGPRDGLQNEKEPVSTEQKRRLIELLCRARVDEVEITSFVSPRWVPQLADAKELVALLAGHKPADVAFSALVPNEHGLAELLCEQPAGSAGRVIDKIAVFTAASETFSQRNTNASIDESLRRFAPVIQQAHAARLLVRGYVSCAIRCPFEGDVAPARVMQVARRLTDLGVDELDLADTIGAATPQTTLALLDAARQELAGWPSSNLTLHFHDTHGRAVDCVAAALAAGIRSFDAAAGGLGGCPFASTATERAPGNISTQRLVDAITRAGLSTRAEPAALAEAAGFAMQLVSA